MDLDTQRLYIANFLEKLSLLLSLLAMATHKDKIQIFGEIFP